RAKQKQEADGAAGVCRAREPELCPHGRGRQAAATAHPLGDALARSGGGGQRGVGGKFASPAPCLPLLSPDQCVFAEGLSLRFKRREPILPCQGDRTEKPRASSDFFSSSGKDLKTAARIKSLGASREPRRGAEARSGAAPPPEMDEQPRLLHSHA
ncbi:hypothetical protein MC885_000284, partial [Smutsia gigantea]